MMTTGLSRRATLAGLMGMGAALAGCSAPPRPAIQPLPPPPTTTGGRLPATADIVSYPEAVGLNAVIDISHSNTVADFGAVRSGSAILGVVHKATEGVGWADPRYQERRGQAEAAGLLWGAYHFGTYQHSGAEQAEAFLALAQPEPRTLMALDLELNERDPANSMDLSRGEDFVRAILAATGRLPLVYIHPAWADGEPLGGHRRTLGGAVRRDSILAACDLWLADYRVRPELPGAWAATGWRFWQYAGDDSGGPFRSYSRGVAGIDRCDRSLFGGDAAALARYWLEQAGRPRG
jgi:lysozyme